MEKLLIIDGHNLLFQSFYGMPRKITNHRGENVEAVICFVGILSKVLKLLKPDFVCVVFDGENRLERKNLLQEYKANRKDFKNVEQSENPFAQLEFIKQVLNHCEIYNVEMTDCETDDYIASLVNKYRNDLHISIFSQDKDFYQLICENVDVFHYRGKISQIIDEKVFYEKFGFNSKFFDTYLALTGDKSDNIDGVKGIGKVTAKNLILKFGDLKNILRNRSLIENKKLQKKIEDGEQKLHRNFALCNLKNVKNYNFDLSQTKVKSFEIKTMEILKTLDIL